MIININSLIYIVFIFLFIYLFFSNIYTNGKNIKNKEGFFERPEFKDKINNTYNCKTFDCIVKSEDKCAKMCENKLKTKLQSKSAVDNCKYECLKSGDQMRDSLSYQIAIFGRTPYENEL